MKVIKVDKATCDKWVGSKHYSRRPSIFWAGFALVIEGQVEGVVVYGQPSPPIQKHAFTDRDFRLYELSRLVIQTGRKNAASFLVGNSLKMLDTPCAVVSYADTNYNHCGFIYQATNWIYTGATKSHDHTYIVDGVRMHPMTVRDKFGVTNLKKWAADNGIKTEKPKDKHRYFYVVGNKKQKANMKSKLKYTEVKPYPKLDPIRYDDGPKL